MITLSRHSLLFLLAILSTAFSMITSDFNKYQLSFEILDSMRHAILDSSAHIFYSLPNSLDKKHDDYSLSVNEGNKWLGGNISGRLITDVNDRDPVGNFFVGANCAFKSPWLEAVFAADYHSSNIPNNSNGISGLLLDQTTESKYTGYNQIEGNIPSDFNYLLGYLKFGNPGMSLIFGNYKLRWGPGYKGTLLLSGTTPSPLYLYLLQVGIGDVARMSAFLNFLDDDFLFSKEKTGRYSAAQRVDISFGKHVQIGLYELVNFSGVNLLARYANPLQLYYVGNVSGGEAERLTNVMGGGDLNIIFSPLRLYADFLNDDLSPFDHNDSPNKWGYQLGVTYSSFGPLAEVGLEYSHLSWGTFTHRNPGLAQHTYWNEPRGWPWGNDQDNWCLHTYVKALSMLDIIGEANVWVKGEGDMSSYHWDIIESTGAKIAGHGDNEGDFQDYANDPVQLSLLMTARYKSSSWMQCDASIRPGFSKNSSPTLALKGAITFSLPGNLCTMDLRK